MFIGLFSLLVPLAVIGGVVYAIVVATRRDRESRPSPPPVRHDLGADLDRDLARWVDAGLLSEAQSSAIVAHEHQTLMIEPVVIDPAVHGASLSPTTAMRRRSGMPAVAEALGYLGGILAIVGLVLLVGRYWDDMATAGRLALSAGAALALLIGGAVLHESADPALARLRWFLWLIGTAATALFVALLMRDAFGMENARGVAIICAAAVALLSGILWFWRERPIQQFTCIAALVALVGLSVAELASDGAGGLAVWGFGAVLLIASLGQVTPLPVLTEIVAALSMGVGAAITASDWSAFGLILAVTTAMILFAVAEIPGLAPTATHVVIAAVFGGIVCLQAVPSALGYFALDAGLATGLATWLIGAGLVYVGGLGVIRVPVLAEIAGGLAMIGGAALTGVQFHGFAPLFGIVTAIGLVGLGMLPGRVLMSVLGSLGLLINVPWAIGWYFPGEGRAPLLILVSGVLVIAVAVLLTRMGDRFRHELGANRDPSTRFGSVHHPKSGARHGKPPPNVTPMPS